MKKIVQIVESTATGTLSIAVMATNTQAKIDDLVFIYSRRAETPENIKGMFAQDIVLIEENFEKKSTILGELITKGLNNLGNKYPKIINEIRIIRFLIIY